MSVDLCDLSMSFAACCKLKHFVFLQNLSEDDDIPEPPVCPCIGMGIVRGVDVKNNIAYIVSDLSLSEIEKVNCVIRGDLVLPESFLTNNEKIVSVLILVLKKLFKLLYVVIAKLASKTIRQS